MSADKIESVLLKLKSSKGSLKALIDHINEAV